MNDRLFLYCPASLAAEIVRLKPRQEKGSNQHGQANDDNGYSIITAQIKIKIHEKRRNALDQDNDTVNHARYCPVVTDTEIARQKVRQHTVFCAQTKTHQGTGE